MPSYKAPIDEALFLLRDVLHIDRYAERPAFGDTTPDLLEAVLTEAGRFAEGGAAAPQSHGGRRGLHAAAGWRGRQRRTGSGRPTRSIGRAGWQGISSDPAFGGQGLPSSLGVLVNEFCTSANMAFTMYPGLTKSAISALLVHGSEEQKRALSSPKLISGEWLGTMNLTEPQCGTDLGLLTTKAVPQAGRHPTGSPARRSSSRPASTTSRTTSSISCWPGSRARRPAPRASRCSSCPRSWSSADGSLGARNAVSLRLDRAQDGHPRQRDLRHELRRRDRAGSWARPTAASTPCS